MGTRKKATGTKPQLKRMSLIKAVLQGYRIRLDEELQPLGITTAQLRLLWTVEENPSVSGAKVARLCSVTPQTGQALLARMEAQGWLRRRASEESERVLVAELTASGRRILRQAKTAAEELEHRLWSEVEAPHLRVLDQTLAFAVAMLAR